MSVDCTARRRAVVAAAALCVAGLAVGVSPASAAVTCTKWAATSGSDANSGDTKAAAYWTLDKLVASLPAGKTGCLPPGETYFADEGNGIIKGGGGTAAAPVRITSGPGGRAVVKGAVDLLVESHDVIISGLDFRGSYKSDGTPFQIKGTHLHVSGDRVRIVDNDISDPLGICIGAGRGHATAPEPNEVAESLVVARNRIHDCGMDPSINWVLTGEHKDSGAHGVYLENTLNARVTENLIYRNRYRGLQLWPRNDGAVIDHNLFDESATHVNIGSSLTDDPAGPYYAQNTKVRDNILTGRVTTFAPDQNPSQVYGNFPEISPTYGNEVYGNCFAPNDDPPTGGTGYTVGANTTAQALFVDRAARDYRLTTASPCAGKGPGSIQAIDRFVTVTAPASAATGDVPVAAITVTNRTATTGPVTVTVTAPAAKLLKLTPSAGSCTAVQCTATLPAGGALTISARVGATKPGPAVVTAKLGETDATPGDNSAGATIIVSGPACTYVGTDAVNTVQGTAAAEVFCLFAGNDVVMPAGGDDTVLAGTGIDRTSYSNAPNAVVLNLTQRVAVDAGAGTAIGWDTLSSVEWGTGTAYGDTLVGSAVADILDGLEGADGIRGLGGNDTLNGWSGNDRLYGGDGNDTLDGGPDVDFCEEGAGTKVACEQ